jgi:branched-subunit amino acid aminotransferase/4-amino-4-deoxychorismate lyase
MLISETAVRIMDWGYRRPDVTYDVVSVRDGRFFRLGDCLRRFRASMDKLRVRPKESDEDIRALLTAWWRGHALSAGVGRPRISPIVLHKSRTERRETREADEVFLTTTAGGVMPASRVDERILGNDRPGSISTCIREAFWAKRVSGCHAIRVDYNACSSLH